MAGMQETDRLTLKNGITYLLQDAKARAQLADLLTEVMEKYGADNPPPYPVTSVNGQTGDVIVGGAVDSVNGQTGVVVLGANDVGALPNTTQIPSKTSDLTNDSGFVNAAGAAAAAPVQSVNGQTGAVTVHGVPTGGTTGQVLKKAGNADYDTEWGTGGASGSGIAIQDDEPTDGELVWIDTDDPGTPHIIPEIDDTQESASDTWSSQKIADEIAAAGADFNLIYPVGSIYMSVNSTSPATLFGGTWEQIEDRFLLGAGTTYSAGSTGGSATMEHTHSIAHTHNLDSNGYAKVTMWSDGGVLYREKSGIPSWTSTYRAKANSGGSYNGNNTWGAELGGKTAGSNAANSGAASNANNMPPYLAVYMWKRTA